MGRFRGLVVVGILGLLAVAPVARADHGTGTGQSFTFLQPGFQQDVFGTWPSFLGGVAFAPDGDPLVDLCQFGGSPLVRFDRQGAAPVVGGSKLHPATSTPSNAGCGITNHPDGTLYTNTRGGVVNLDASTGAQLRPAFGPSGNALGIAPDPQTGKLVYVGSDGTLYWADPVAGTSSVFSTVTTGNFLDGIYFDPTGEFLFVANRSPVFRLTILRRTGALAQHVALPSEPDGIAFHALPPKFVVSINLDGTITRFDFPGDDFTAAPTLSLFASGGFRGDLSQVGPDGCLYLTQNGTRYDDGSTSGHNSLVRICPGFAPPPGVTPVRPTTAICASPPVPGPGDIVGTPGDDVIVGTAGDDRIFGLGGNDRIDGGGGNDIIFGGDGNDQLQGGDGDDVLCGGNGNDLLDGGAGNDALAGGPGNDRLRGGTGDDVLEGGPGFDDLDGGPGSNTIDGGPDFDSCANPGPPAAVNCP